MVSEQELQEFFNRIDSINYLVMRNYVGLLEDINTGGDIDLLIDNGEEFVKSANALPLNNRDKCYNYKVQIGDSWIPVDIRVVGDGYYDSEWEKAMLSGRVLYKEGFYVMDKEDYYYSILYHSMLHKAEIPQKYMHLFEERGISSLKDMQKALNGFMKNKGYKYVTPVDKGVKFNTKNLRKLKFSKMFNIGRISADN